MCASCLVRNYEDAYTDPGSPLMRVTEWGTHVLALVNGERKLLMEVGDIHTSASLHNL
jgi:hypothetical protein